MLPSHWSLVLFSEMLSSQGIRLCPTLRTLAALALTRAPLSRIPCLVCHTCGALEHFPRACPGEEWKGSVPPVPVSCTL